MIHGWNKIVTKNVPTSRVFYRKYIELKLYMKLKLFNSTECKWNYMLSKRFETGKLGRKQVGKNHHGN